MIGVYKITNPKGLVYIGSSKDINTRWKWYRKLRCNSQIKLCNSLKKYGVDNHIFEIIEECDVEILLERELFYGTFYNCLDKKKWVKLSFTQINGRICVYVTRDKR